MAGSFAANAGSFAYYHNASSNCAVIWKRHFSGLNLIRSVAFSSDETKVLISASETASATSEVFMALDATSSDPFANSPIIIKQTISGVSNAAIFHGGPFMISTNKFLIVGG